MLISSFFTYKQGAIKGKLSYDISFLSFFYPQETRGTENRSHIAHKYQHRSESHHLLQ